MNEWEAKYKALAMGATREQVEVAEIFVKKAIDISVVTGKPLATVIYGMMSVTQFQQIKETKVLLNED